MGKVCRVAPIPVGDGRIFEDGTMAKSGGAGRGDANSADGVHSPLTRARGERRSRSVPRLKVAGHVTKGAHPLASASRVLL
ncbi:unnamed protein product, partial [Iphiclides podalirius]